MKKKAVQKVAKRALRARRLPSSQLQYGALCYRHTKSGLQVMLVTSRRTKRWISPKGWPMKGIKPPAVAATEAYEEAGVRGNVSKNPLGFYSYRKFVNRREGMITCLVQAYALEVTEVVKKFPEAAQRERRWLKPKKAAKKVRESELAALIRVLADQVNDGSR
ncbi:MAG: NUDIX hydrolase [Pseudomonadota bacterium]